MAHHHSSNDTFVGIRQTFLMRLKPRNCIHCGEEYTPTPHKPGFINECWDCGEVSDKDTPRLGGNMIYSHKTAPTIEIKPLDQAQQFAKRARRQNSTGVTNDLVQTKQ